jgi:predicted acetylornithine/succinylornithine family transaminase
MTDWIADEAQYLLQNYRRQPVVLTRGQGTCVWDENGKEYLDFVAGLASVTLGHSHPVLVEAVQKQAEQLMLVSNLYYTTPMVELAKLLVENSCLDRAFFCNSGAEANEAAIKLARKWGRETKDGAYEIIATLAGFHGRTLATVTATGTERYKAPFAPLPEGFLHVPFNDVEALQAATTARTCAVMVEPVQGEGGVNVPDPDYLKRVRAWCDEQNVLLVLDEVQTGVGRLGTLWGHQYYGIEPDIMTLAKALGGGMPVAAMLLKEDLLGYLVPGDHGTTFGGNPIATAAAAAVFRYVVENDLPAQAAKQGEQLMARLRGIEDRHEMVTEVRGVGLMCAIELDGEHAATLVDVCRERGLLVNNVRPTTLRFIPPLTVSDEEIDRACEILDEALTEVRENV